MPLFALDYGLVTRSLTATVDYQPTSTTTASASVPVFAVGRTQLCEFFGLRGHAQPTRDYVFPLFLGHVNFDDAEYVLVSMGTRRVPSKSAPDRIKVLYTLCLFDAYKTFEETVMHARDMLEHDACDLGACALGVDYSYEIWQICDDHDLWWEWETESHIYWVEELREEYIAGTTDGPHFYPTIVKRSALMSEDYVSSLRLAANLEHLRQLREAASLDDDGCEVSRIEKLECCVACGERLSKPYQFFIDGHGLVCHRCWQWYTHWRINVFDPQTLADRLLHAALCDGFEDDPDWEDDGRPDGWWEDVEAADASEVC